MIHNDFWSSSSEKKDLLILLSFLIFFFYVFFLNVFMVSGWRYFYFLNIFIVYFFSFGIYFMKIISIKYIKDKFFVIFNGIFIILIMIDLYKFHPYQSIYFNNTFKINVSKNFQVDTPSLSRVDALKFILADSPNKLTINVGNTSWTPFSNGKDLLSENDKKKLVFVGQELKKADYIYTNTIYLHDVKLTNKYKGPDDFIKIKEFKINNIEIYSIYKRK